MSLKGDDMTKAEDRRKVNKWQSKIFLIVSSSLFASSVYVVYAAGSAVNKIEHAEQDIIDLNIYRDKTVINAAIIEHLTKTQDTTVQILNRINDRLRDIELKVEHEHK